MKLHVLCYIVKIKQKLNKPHFTVILQNVTGAISTHAS